MKKLMLVAGLAVVAAACETNDITLPPGQFHVGEPAQLQLVSADAEAEMLAGSTVENIRVLTLDAAGNPTTAEVHFNVTAGEGTVSHDVRTTTLSRGIADNEWRLAATPGTNVLTISAPWTNETITIEVEGLLGPPATIDLVEDSPWEEEMVGIPGVAFEDDIVVVVRDQAGNPIAGEEVVFAYVIGEDEDGDDEIAEYSVTTDADGEAAFTWTLPASGPQTLTATVADEDGETLASLAVTAFGEIGDPAIIEAVAGHDGEGEPGDEIDLVVEVTDEYGTPVADAVVDFAVVAGDGSVFNPRARTNANGIASMTYTFGEAEDQQVEASIGVDAVIFTLTLADDE